MQAMRETAHSFRKSTAQRPLPLPQKNSLHLFFPHSSFDTEQLASAAPSHSASADKHPRTPTIGREYGAEGSMPALGAEGRHLQGRKLVWGGKEHGALRLGTPRHTDLHFDPQATTFLSPPGGIYLIGKALQAGPNTRFALVGSKLN